MLDEKSLSSKVTRLVSETKTLRSEVSAATIEMYRAYRQLECAKERLDEQIPEIEAMFKSEVLGRLAHFETRIESQIDDLRSRVEMIERSGFA